jgi:hypothetical protein
LSNDSRPGCKNAIASWQSVFKGRGRRSLSQPDQGPSKRPPKRSELMVAQPSSLWHGHQFEEMAVRDFEIDAPAAAPIIEFPIIRA